MIIASPQIINMLKPLHPFRTMNDSQITEFVVKLKSTQFTKGDLIYNQGDETDRLYLVYEGSVQLTTQRRGDIEELGHLDRGDFFGFEAWDINFLRQAKAIALSDVTLLYLEWDVMHNIADTLPQVKAYFQMISNPTESNISRKCICQSGVGNENRKSRRSRP